MSKKLVIDLEPESLNEGFLSTFKVGVSTILKSLLGIATPAMELVVRGSSDKVKAFVDALAGEASYMKAFRNYGLDSPQTHRNKKKLDVAIKSFERKTGISWPME